MRQKYLILSSGKTFIQKRQYVRWVVRREKHTFDYFENMCINFIIKFIKMKLITNPVITDIIAFNQRIIVFPELNNWKYTIIW